MARRLNMSTLRTRCQQRADKENAKHIGVPEWNSMISSSYAEAWQAVAGTGTRYFETEVDIVATGAPSYALPDDHLSTIGVDRVLNATSGERVQLRPIAIQERTRWIGRTGDAVRVDVVGDQVILYPKPSSGTYKLLYIPQPTDLSNAADVDEVDLVTADGEEFVIWATVVKAKAKSEEDVRLAMAEREAARVRLVEWAVARYLTEPKRRVVEDELDSYADPNGLWNPASWRYR